MPRRKKEEEALHVGPRPTRGAANARERTRMRVLSKAFGRLKLTLPWVPADTKLSKLDTLRLATTYIRHLKALVDQGELDNHQQNENHEQRFLGNCDINAGSNAFPYQTLWPLIRATKRNGDSDAEAAAIVADVEHEFETNN